MSVTLVAISDPKRPGLFYAEDLIVYCARVSNPNNQLNISTGDRLLKYCIDHGHWSIFETASMTVEIKTSRAVAAQILRHRSFNFQEFSQRYAEVQERPACVEGRAQSAKNRQSSVEPLTTEDALRWQQLQEASYDRAYADYEYALKLGVAREQARMLLPLATPTTLYMTGSVRSYIHYLQLRCAAGTQQEHREVADAVKALFVVRFPQVSKALGWA